MTLGSIEGQRFSLTFIVGLIEPTGAESPVSVSRQDRSVYPSPRICTIGLLFDGYGLFEGGLHAVQTCKAASTDLLQAENSFNFDIQFRGKQFGNFDQGAGREMPIIVLPQHLAQFAGLTEVGDEYSHFQQ